jgi:predicted metal-binding membrane protein
VAWIVTVARMRGMDDGPGTDLGGLGWYLGIWVTMMAAMMLPSVAPMVLFQKVVPRGDRLVVPFAAAFVAFGIWIAVVPEQVPGLTGPGQAPAMHMSSMK